jgi:hypothetical protein
MNKNLKNLNNKMSLIEANLTENTNKNEKPE